MKLIQIHGSMYSLHHSRMYPIHYTSKSGDPQLCPHLIKLEKLMANLVKKSNTDSEKSQNPPHHCKR